MPEPGTSVEVIMLGMTPGAAYCRELSTGERLRVRGGLWECNPGEIGTLKVTKRWVFGGAAHYSGDIRFVRLDVKALGLTPLRLEDQGLWDPCREVWSDPPERWQTEIIAWGPRHQYEMEQVLPGFDPEDPWGDPILKSQETADPRESFTILQKLCLEDLRCLDAHAHLGNRMFDCSPAGAIRHYETGVRIGELSFSESFDGLLPWGHIDNRPFLRCLHGYGLCLWRLKRFEEASAVFRRLLWLNPADNLGVRSIIDEVRRNEPWKPDGR